MADGVSMQNFSTWMCFAFTVVCTSAHAMSHQTYLLGDWQGQRKALAEQGIQFELNATADAAYLAHGGRNEHADPTVAAQFWLGTSADLEKLWGWDGVIVRAVAIARQGRSTSVGDLQDPSAPQLANLQSSFGRGNQDSRLSELSIEKQFKEQGLSIKAGRLGLGMDFNVMACDFQSTAFCAAQMGKWQGNIWMNTPVSQWGMRAKQQFNPTLAIQVGVYEFNPDNGNAKAEGQGWSLDTDHADGVTIPVEMVWLPKHAINGLAGSYRVGAMYNTADDPKNQKDIAIGVVEDRTYAAWLAVEQQLTRTGTGRQGLHAFANFTWHDRTTNKVENTQQLGLKYIGLLDSQPNDILGFAMNRVHVNDRFADAQAEKGNTQFNEDAEWNVELNYSYSPVPWLMLRPNVQYVVHPGASNRVDDAWVLGLGSKVIF